MKNIKYIVGIDFGHGETTANYIEIYDKKEKKYSEPKQLSIKEGSDGKKIIKIRSFFCRYRTIETEPWNYDLDPTDTRISNYIRRMLSGEWLVQFNHSFKIPMNTDSYQEEVFGQFVNCVYKNIVDYNGLDSQVGLMVNDNLEPQNFLLYAACPSGWSDEQRDSFRIFLKKNGVPCEKVFKESDAAWVSFLPQKLSNLDKPQMLVVDYGSSTIDLTWSEDIQKDIYYPNALGASRVESAIFDYLINNDVRAQNEYKKLLDLIPDEFFLNEIIKLGIRSVKEDFYSEILEYPDKEDIEWRGYLLSNTFSKNLGLTHFGDEIPLNQVNIILNQYIEEVRVYFQKFRKEHMENSGSYITPKRIILTGGASRMNFVKVLIKDVFGVEPIIDETKASESISAGIALAGTKDFLLDNDVHIPNPPEDNEIKLLVLNNANKIIQEYALGLLNSIFDSWQQGNIVMDVERNLNSKLIEISEDMKSRGDVGIIWDRVTEGAIDGELRGELYNGNKSIHALLYAVIDSIRGLNVERNYALLDNITQVIEDYYNDEIEFNIIPNLINYVKIYAPLTTESDLKELFYFRLERLDASISISEDTITKFLTILVKTAFQTIVNKDFFSVTFLTLNKDRNYRYRNGYFDTLRNDFESFSQTLETSISNIDKVVSTISGSIVTKMEEIQNYCRKIRI